MINPYFCYALSFYIAFVCYMLPWSQLYPSLSVSLALFLLLTIIGHVYCGYRLFKSRLIKFRPIKVEGAFPAIVTTVFLYCLWGLEFAYEGGVPLLKILLNLPYNYRLFGIPSLHVFIVTFSSFYTIYLFHLYLSSRQRLLAILFVINLSAAILIYSRAMFFFNLSACFFMFLWSRKKIPNVILLSLPFIMIVLFYVFGVLGTLRVSREANVKYDNSLFLEIGKASDNFKKSFIAEEFFWTYIYITSPLANLQHNINTQHPETGVTSFLEMINNEIFMDFISKRINSLSGVERKGENTIPGPFNVSTVYSRSFSYIGWIGIITMAALVLILPNVFIKILPSDSPFFATGIAILCTMFLFLAYDNTLRFTGLSFQLVYPVLLHYGSRKFPQVKSFFVNNKVTTM